ncbi:cadherin-like domain-containing protein, partial [Methylobacter svalbardensis]|uniref:cadherin-like domain-containing protein n=1 Tax=Methylobacter svalbardensis TaxID=3080016 RepID=UPI0030EC6470
AASALTGNDSDPEGDTYSITGFTQTSNGTLAQNQDGSFTYTPTANYNGGDSFTYTITDSQGATDTATVTINVTPVNDPPVAVNDIYANNDALTTAEDTPLTIAASALTGNDSDPEGDTYSITGFTQTSNGTLAQNQDGSFTYTPNANYNGGDSFTYTITDSQGATDTATVTINVTPVN